MGYKEDLEAVKRDGLALKFVKEQTPELCLAAVKRDGLALQFVKEQTPEICSEAVKQDRWALRFVRDKKLKEWLGNELSKNNLGD